MRTYRYKSTCAKSKQWLLSALLSLLACAVLNAVFSGCGQGTVEREGVNVSGNTLTIFSSLPLQGKFSDQAQDIIAGEKLALKHSKGKAGKFQISYMSLDDATNAAGSWEPGQVSANARKAAQDPLTIAYIGELNSSASAISIPILNEAGILQLSPASTVVGLTENGLGAARGEPDKYYPSGNRTFGRILPNDRVQSSAVIQAMETEQVKSLAVVNNGKPYGNSLSRLVVSKAKEAGIQVDSDERLEDSGANIRTVISDIRKEQVDALFLGADLQDHSTIPFLKAITSASKDIKIFLPDGLATNDFVKQLGQVQGSIFVTSPQLQASFYPASGQQFFADFKKENGRDPSQYAIFGYEAMDAILTSIRAAGSEGNNRQKVIDAFLRIRDKESVLGVYSIQRSGDTSLTDYGLYRIEDNKLTFLKVLKPTTTN